VAARGSVQTETARAEVERVEDFVDRFPGWAGLLVALEARTLALERAVEGLNGRMRHYRHLSAPLNETTFRPSGLAGPPGVVRRSVRLVDGRSRP